MRLIVLFVKKQYVRSGLLTTIGACWFRVLSQLWHCSQNSQFLSSCILAPIFTPYVINVSMNLVHLTMEPVLFIIFFVTLRMQSVYVLSHQMAVFLQLVPILEDELV
jgi:hypothetical protein